MKNYIVCSAIYYDDGIERVHQPKNIKTGIVITGLRHCNCFAIAKELFQNRDYIGKEIQGFLTSENVFVNRELAGKIAVRACQTKELKSQLFSEDIY
ncbi:MAG TPA: hypothetical protein VGD05_02290 [Pyrinomonadaceae bacterium]|jgi:hypothetical protein